MKSENAITFSAPVGMYPDVFAAKMTISGTEIFQQHEQLFPTFHGKPRLDQFAVGLPQCCKLNVRYYRCFPTSISSLSVTPGSAQALKFTMSFNYQIKRIIRLPDPNSLMSAICVVTGGETSNSY